MMIKIIKKSEIENYKRDALYWENEAKRLNELSDYYQTELEKAHALIGRIVHQFSERWDIVNITKDFPTNNLFGNRSYSNPTGKKGR